MPKSFSAQTFMQSYLPNLAATAEAAKAFAPKLRAGDVVYLEGPLGAGKTSFVQALLSALGYEGSATSPTYTLVEIYELAAFTVFHFDFYRLKDPEELAFIGIEEYFSPEAICLIEWPERAEGKIPKPDWRIFLSPEKNGRNLVIEEGA